VAENGAGAGVRVLDRLRDGQRELHCLRHFARYFIGNLVAHEVMGGNGAGAHALSPQVAPDFVDTVGKHEGAVDVRRDVRTTAIEARPQVEIVRGSLAAPLTTPEFAGMDAVHNVGAVRGDTGRRASQVVPVGFQVENKCTELRTWDRLVRPRKGSKEGVVAAVLEDFYRRPGTAPEPGI